ncbi:aspartate aminotransferase family protein [Candidatus Sumerlaeota bacterium]|nr:aspartate aminotransferase family protein [Candidatus Sumerlaeota bacterium]
MHDSCLTPNYGPRRLAIVRGEGSRVWDADGKEYLDFLTGISVDNLGHCHPRITKAIQEQAATLVHCSNLYYIPVQIEFARYLTSQCFAERVFFGNSGAEANEAAIKIARRWSFENCGENPARIHVVTMNQSFHGRTHATMWATGQEKIKKHFFPPAEGFSYAEFNDLDSVKKLLNEHTCAIMVEPIQGEGGIRPAAQEFLAGLRELCDARKILLIFDEVQCGLGRAGHLFAHQYYGIEPDIMTLAKSLGGGLAMGAMLTTAQIAEAFGAGAHASTMGGNAVTSAAGLAYLHELVEGDWPRKARESGEYFVGRFKSALGAPENLAEIRWRGLMIGIEVKSGGPEIVASCEEAGLLINCTAGQTLRLLPPLNVSRAEMDSAIEILINAIRSAKA